MIWNAPLYTTCSDKKSRPYANRGSAELLSIVFLWILFICIICDIDFVICKPEICAAYCNVWSAVLDIKSDNVKIESHIRLPSASSGHAISRWYITIQKIRRRSVYLFVDEWKHGPWLDIKVSSNQYRKSHPGDKTTVRSSYLHNWNPCTGNIYLNLIRPAMLLRSTNIQQQRRYNKNLWFVTKYTESYYHNIRYHSWKSIERNELHHHLLSWKNFVRKLLLSMQALAGNKYSMIIFSANVMAYKKFCQEFHWHVGR